MKSNNSRSLSEQRAKVTRRIQRQNELDSSIQESNIQESRASAKRSNLFSRAYRFVRSKMILHAIPHSDWPSPQLIFGSDKVEKEEPKPVRFSTDSSGSVRTNSSDVSTIVAGFMQFERSFKRNSRLSGSSNHQAGVPRLSLVSKEGGSSKRPSCDAEAAITIPTNILDHYTLGEAIEQCLKSRQKQ